MALVDETELLARSVVSESDVDRVVPRRQAWIQVLEPLESAPTPNIFTFVHPIQTLGNAMTGDDDDTRNGFVLKKDSVALSIDIELNADDLSVIVEPGTPIASHVIDIDALLDAQKLDIEQANQVEKSYIVPTDLPAFGLLHYFQLGVKLGYTTLCLRRDVSPRILMLDETSPENEHGTITSGQIHVFAHAGLAFNESTEALIIRQKPSDNTTHAHRSTEFPKGRLQKKKKRKKKRKTDLPVELLLRDKLSVDAGKAAEVLDRKRIQDKKKIGNKGAIDIFHALRVNKPLVSLTLQDIGLGDLAMIALGAMLRCNMTLTKLDLQGNCIGPVGIHTLCDALEDIPDSNLLELNLSHNYITDSGMSDLCRAFRENETLVWLDISWNQFSSLALIRLLGALRENFVLRQVAIYGNDLDEDRYCLNIECQYAKLIAAGLRQVNSSFAEIALSSATATIPVDKLKDSRWVELPNRELMEIDAVVISDILPLNRKILTLDLSDNPGITRFGVLEILKTIRFCKTLKMLKLVNTGLFEEAAEQIGELVASNQTLETIVMHEMEIQVQQVRGSQGVEFMKFDIDTRHHFDRWILAKCFLLNRPTQELNKLRLPVATSSSVLIGKKAHISINLSGREFELYEVAFLSKKIFHHLQLARVALNGCKIDSHGGAALADSVRNHASLEILEMENNLLQVSGGKAMIECIQFNSSLTYLNLSWNKIGNDGAVGLGRALQANRSILRLDLRGNEFSAGALSEISKGLARNACLQELYLRWNVICAVGAAALAQALTQNKCLRILDVENQVMGPAGALAFAAMLKQNTTLRELNMKGDDAILDGDAAGIGSDQAKSIALVLTEVNQSLTHLNIGQNAIGKDGVVWFNDLLKFTKSLLVLDLSFSQLESKGSIRFFECLAMNKTLVKLNLAHNRISNEGMTACIKALEANHVLRELNVAHNAITEEPFVLLCHKLELKVLPFALAWLCLTDNIMTERTYSRLRSLAGPSTLTIELEHVQSSAALINE